MKKFGFTLAEVLITLGIIGVVAALTAPQLVLSSRNEATCSRLSSTVSNLENAFQNAIVQEGVPGLRNTSIWTATNTNARAGNLGKYIHLGGVDGSRIVTKSGTSIIINKTASPTDRTTTAQTVYDNGGSLLIALGSIDIFTDTGTAREGRNYFRFYVGNDGVLYPYGGRDYAVYLSNNGVPAATDMVDSSATATGNNACNETKQTLRCTARVVNDGYKMNY